MMEKHPNERKRKTYEVFNRLKTKYQVDICRFDHAAITVFGITEKQFSALCGELHLSLIHISEPTRLRRISYAVFCLKKKKKPKQKTHKQ